MGMARERERDASGTRVKISGSCTIRITGSSVRDARERAGQIVDAAKAVVPEPDRDLVAEPGEPEARAALAEQHGVVLEHRDVRPSASAWRAPAMSYHQS